uniref:Large ribosomal subunit protein bL21m n=1 Tax=Crocodylus porosus TaxID=8502 RepID=A0A7M4FWQ5_CROPO
MPPPRPRWWLRRRGSAALPRPYLASPISASRSSCRSCSCRTAKPRTGIASSCLLLGPRARGASFPAGPSPLLLPSPRYSATSGSASSGCSGYGGGGLLATAGPGAAARNRLVVKTSLSSPPWPVFKLPDPVEETKYHTEVVQRVNEMIATGQYGRLFAVVHLASKQWKVTSEDLILMENFLPAECGDRIRLEKVLLVGADDFTLIGKPLLGKDLVRVEATVIEKTESWPKINMKFWKRHSYRKKKVVIQPQTVLRINSIEIFPCLS